MKPFLKKIATIFGILSIIFPLLMGILWFKFVKEQESLIGNSNTTHQPCEPFGMTTKRQSDKLVVMWQTNNACSGFVLLGKTYADFSNLPFKVLSAEGEAPTKTHVITILRQDELQYRYAIVVSDGEWFGINGNPFQYK